MDKRTYTTEAAAAELGVTPARVRQMILNGLLETERFGRAHVITADALEKARQRRTKPGPAPKAQANNQPAKPAKRARAQKAKRKK